MADYTDIPLEERRAKMICDLETLLNIELEFGPYPGWDQLLEARGQLWGAWRALYAADDPAAQYPSLLRALEIEGEELRGFWIWANEKLLYDVVERDLTAIDRALDFYGVKPTPGTRVALYDVPRRPPDRRKGAHWNTPRWCDVILTRDPAAFVRWMGAALRDYEPACDRRRRGQEVELPPEHEPVQQPQQGDQFEAEEILAAILAAGLSAREAEAVRILAAGEVSTQELAEALGTSRNNADQIKHRLRKKFEKTRSSL